MTLFQLIQRNFFFHRRGNCAVLLGVAVGTAVLTGALLVGDSLRGSLHDLVNQQLAWVDDALVSGRFIREKVTENIRADRKSHAILLQGAMTARRDQRKGSDTELHRVPKISILGVEDRFWTGANPFGPRNATGASATSEIPSADGVVLNVKLAEDLGVGVGDTLSLYLQKISAVPRETLLGRKDAGDVLDEWILKVENIVSDADQGNFTLTPSPVPPRNAFVALASLQKKLHQEGRINVVLVGGTKENPQIALDHSVDLDDWGLVLQDPAVRSAVLFSKLDRNHDGKLARGEWRGRLADSIIQEADHNHDGTLTREEIDTYYREKRPYLSLESRNMILDPVLARASMQAAGKAGVKVAPTLVYLANGISAGSQTIPYSIVAALEPELSAPLGPFAPVGAKELQDDEIILADWKKSPLSAKVGDEIRLTYFPPEESGQLRERTATFRLKSKVPLQGAAGDSDITPEFPGITDKLGIRDWDPPFPFDNKRVQERDEKYWNQYRTTPKAYVTLKTGEKLWGSRFGQWTSIRMAPTSPKNLGQAANDFRRAFREILSPEQGGLIFESVRGKGFQASTGGTDFGGLFLGFSFFLIAAALLLVGLLFRLNLERRSEEVGLFMAAGFRRGTIRRLFLIEGTMIAALGAALGLLGAAIYAWGLLKLLEAWWPTPLQRSFLRLHAASSTFLVGYFSALAVSLLTIVWATRLLARISPSALLAGQTLGNLNLSGKSPRWSLWLIPVSGMSAVCLMLGGGWVKDQEMRASVFFGSGALLLTAGLAAVWIWLRRESSFHIAPGTSSFNLLSLAFRNAARNPVRSLLTVGLLASATFLLVAVESFHQDPGQDFLSSNSGSGGYALLAESDVPLFQDLNSEEGRDALNIPEQNRQSLAGTKFFPFRLRAGEDASCLNLYQPKRPRLLGVPPEISLQGGFQFQSSEAGTAEEKENPWQLLDKPLEDGAIPVLGEANTVEWMLKSGLGKELEVANERGDPVKLRFVGLLKNSVFQSELLLSEANFLRLYPHQEGFSFFLIKTWPEKMNEVQTILETVLAKHGFAVIPSVQRLEAYLTVENTYLATFQALGGMGLLLGALGLAVVLLRAVWERRAELALFRALGFRRAVLAWVIFAENSFLLLLGLGIGTLAACLAVAPHLAGTPGEIPWLRLAGFLGLVLLAGLSAGAAAATSTLNTPLLPALRRE